MKLTRQDIEEFKKLYETAFNEPLSDAAAEEMASRLMTLYELLAAPLPSERHPQLDASSSTDILDNEPRDDPDDRAS